MAKKGKNATGKGGGQLNNTNAEKWTEIKALRLAVGLLNWYKADKTNIYFKEYLLDNNVYQDVVSHLSGRFLSFSYAIKRAKEWQELRLIKLGTAGTTDKTITIFMLKNHHGYRDEYGLRHSAQGAGTAELAEPELDSEINQLIETMDIEAVEVIEELEATNGASKDGEKEVKG